MTTTEAVREALRCEAVMEWAAATEAWTETVRIAQISGADAAWVSYCIENALASALRELGHSVSVHGIVDYRYRES